MNFLMKKIVMKKFKKIIDDKLLMKSFNNLLNQCSDGMSFSECKKLLESNKKSLKRKNTKNTKRRKKKKHKKTVKVPPSGVVIRKNDKLYQSDGKKLILL